MEDALKKIHMATLDDFPEELVTGERAPEDRFNVHTKWTGETKSVARVSRYTSGEKLEREFEIISDEPLKLHGKEAAPRPTELLLAALNACMAAGYVTNAAEMAIEIKGLEIEANGNLYLQGLLGVEESFNPTQDEVHYKVKICSTAPQDKIEQLHQRVIQYSPNLNSLSKEITMRSTLEIEKSCSMYATS